MLYDHRRGVDVKHFFDRAELGDFGNAIGVVGTREATERIADGTRVRVDGDAGEVTVLG